MFREDKIAEYHEIQQYIYIVYVHAIIEENP